MNILASIHLYPPKHNCGGEYYLHNIFKFLVKRGHRCRVLLHQAGMHNIKTPYVIDGVEVFGGREVQRQDSYSWADVIITHLDYTQYTMVMSWSVKRPLVHLIHNDIPYSSIQNARKGNYIVYNSSWIAKKLNYDHPSFVFTPSVDYNYYNVNDDPFNNEYITMINLDMNKGGHLLREIALRMPDKKFLGVMGSYSSPSDRGQIIEQPGNVKVIPNTKDILSVYRQTRILLMLSLYESWGMTATEAMCNGIPVVCTPTPGLRENCSYAGVYVPAREFEKIDDDGKIIKKADYDVSPVIEELRKLQNEKTYRKVSDLSRERAKELDPENKLFDLENFLININKPELATV